jgi:hypothetical protein
MAVWMTTTILLLTTWLYPLWAYPALELPDPMVPVPPSWFVPVDKLEFSS